MDPGKSRALLDFVNSTGNDNCIEGLPQCSDGVPIVRVIKCMEGIDFRPEEWAENKSWEYVREFLEGSDHPDCRSLIAAIDWDALPRGNEYEIAKIIVLLLSISITCQNKFRMMNEMVNLENESQVHIRHILTETLTAKNSNDSSFYDVLMQKAPANVDQHDLDITMSPTRNSSLALASSVNSINVSPTSSHNLSMQSGTRSTFQTPVRQIFHPMEEEEVYFFVPSSCPPQRRGSRVNMNKFDTLNSSVDCSPMREFLASPVINYKIKMRDLDQKICTLKKNLTLERLAKEDCERQLADKENKCQEMEQRVRELSRRAIDTKQLYDEIDELHEIRAERDTLLKENSKLKHQLDKNETYRNESRDVKRDLEYKMKENEELSREMTVIKNSLSKALENTREVTQLEETCKNFQERNLVLEEEISHLVSDIHKLKTQNADLKELYESRITDLKAIVEEKDSSGLENEGESMGVFIEHRMLELQEKVKDMEATWLKPDAETKLKAELDTAKETMKQFDAKVQSLRGEKFALEEELCHSQQELTGKSAELMDLLKNLAATNQKLKSSETSAEALRTRIDSLTNDRESQKSRIKDLESELVQSTQRITKLQVELNMAKSDNESKVCELERHTRRLCESNQKVADWEQISRSLELDVSNLKKELEDSEKKCHNLSEKLEGTIKTHNEKVSSLEEEKDSLKITIDSLKSESEHHTQLLDAKVSELSALNDSLRLEKVALETEREARKMCEEACESINQELLSVKKELETSQGQVGNLEKDLEKSKESHSNFVFEMQKKHDSLTKNGEEKISALDYLLQERGRTICDLESELFASRKEMDERTASWKQEKESSEEEMRRLEKANKHLDQQLESTKEELEDLKEFNANLNSTLESSKGANAKMVLTLENLKKGSDAQAEKSKQDIFDLRKEIDSERQFKMDLEKEITFLRKASEETVLTWNQEKEFLVLEKEKLQRELEAREKEFAEFLEKKEQEKRELCIQLEVEKDTRKEAEEGCNTLGGELMATKEKLDDSLSQIIKLKADVEKYVSEISKLSQDIESVKTESGMDIEEKGQKIKELLQFQDTQKEEISTLKSELVLARTHLNDSDFELKSAKENFYEQERQLRNEIQTVKDLGLQKEKEISLLSEEMTAMKEDHENMLTDMETKLKTSEENYLKSQKDIEDLKATLEEHQQKSHYSIEGYEREISQLQSAYENANKALKEHTENSAALLSELSAQRQELLKKFEDVDAELKETRNELHSVETQRKSMELKLRTTEEKSQDLEEQLISYKNEKCSLETSLLNMRDELEEAKLNLKKEIERCDSLKVNLEKANEDAYSLLEKERKLECELKQKSEDVVTALEKISELESAIQKNMEYKSSVEESLKSTQAELSEREKEISRMRKQMEVDEEARQETVNDLVKVKAEVESCQHSHKEEINSLNATIDSLRQDIQDIQQNSAAREAELLEALSQTEEHKNVLFHNLESSKEDISLLNTKNNELDKYVEDLDALLKETKCNLLEVTGRLEASQEAVLSSTEEVSNLKSSLKELEEKLIISESEIEKENNLHKEQESTIIDMKADILNKEAQLEKELNNRNALDEEICSLNEKLSSTMNELDDMRKEMASLHEVSSSQHEKANEEIDNLSMKVKEYEEKIMSDAQELDSAHFQNEKLTKNLDDLTEQGKEDRLKMKSLMEKNKELLKCQEFLENAETELKETKESLEEREKDMERLIEELNLKEATYKEEKEALNCDVNQSKLAVQEMQEKLLHMEEEKEHFHEELVRLEALRQCDSVDLLDLQENLNKTQLELSESQRLAVSLQDQKSLGEKKLEAIRAQFAEKYRSKQDRIQTLEKDLKDWQDRADGQTAKYDNMAAMYNEKCRQLHEVVNNLDQARDENVELQKINRTLKVRNEALTSSSSQMNFKQIEEEKKIKQLQLELRTVKTQLQFADRRIRELQLDADSVARMRSSSVCSQNLPTVKEDYMTPRRHSLTGDDGAFQEDNLFRCRSDTFLDSPTIANKKAPNDSKEETLDDSLDDILRTPVNLQSEKTQKDRANVIDRYSLHTPNNRRNVTRSHISIESSLLSETPSGQNTRHYSRSHQQLNSSSLDASRISHDSTDINMNSSNLAEASFVNEGNRSIHQSMIAPHANSLALTTEEEPGYHNLEWGSLFRVAELQQRNAATLPHLKSSYPVETQGQTPSKCDETIRIGNPDRTMHRLTQTHSSLQQSLAGSMDNPLARRMTMDVGSARQHESSSQSLSTSVAEYQKRRVTGMEMTSHSSSSQKKQREMNKMENPSSAMNESSWNGTIKDNPQENIDPRRQSMMFEIPNSPHKRILRSRGSRRVNNKKEKSDDSSGAGSSRAASLMKTPEKSSRNSKRLEEKRKTPSLMDRVRKPLGRFNSKK